MVNGKDYREMTRHEYAAAVYNFIEMIAPKYHLNEAQKAALKVTLFVESNGIYNARPPVKRYSKAEMLDSKYPRSEFEKVRDKKGTYYAHMVMRTDEEGKSYKDYERLSSAFSVYQVLSETRKPFADELINDLPYSFPLNQGIIGSALMQSDTETLGNYLQKASIEFDHPYDIMGPATAYNGHFLGATQGSKVVKAFAKNPDTRLSDILPEKVFRSNPDLRLPKEMGLGRKPFREWTVAEYVGWINHKYSHYLEDVAKAEAINHPEKPVPLIVAEYRSVLGLPLTETQVALLKNPQTAPLVAEVEATISPQDGLLEQRSAELQEDVQPLIENARSTDRAFPDENIAKWSFGQMAQNAFLATLYGIGDLAQVAIDELLSENRGEVRFDPEQQAKEKLTFGLTGEDLRQVRPRTPLVIDLSIAEVDSVKPAEDKIGGLIMAYNEAEEDRDSIGALIRSGALHDPNFKADASEDIPVPTKRPDRTAEKLPIPTKAPREHG